MNLKKLRIYLDLTQKEMAEKIGVSRSSYGMWEQGREFIPLNTLIVISDTFDISIDYILDLTDTRQYKNSRRGLNKEVLARRIKFIRKINNTTQESLANSLNISLSSISKYENGINLPLTSYLIGFSKYYNISIDYLIGKIDEEIKLEKTIKA